MDSNISNIKNERRQVNEKCYDVIPVLSPAVYCGFGWYGSQRFALWNYFFDWCIIVY